MAHRELGFAIVGCGMIAEFHARAIRELSGGRLITCYSQRQSSAEKFAATHGITAVSSLEAVLAHPDVDVVCICTPSGAHAEPAIAAAAAGKHVVVEKPLEVTLARCDALLEACRKHQVQVCPIFPSRFSPVNLAVKAAITAGRFGRLTLGDTYVKWWRSQEYYDQGGWRGTWQLDGGGAYMNQAIHNVDLLYWFMGEVTDVVAQTATLAHDRIEVEDTGSAVVRFQHGALGTITATTAAWPGLLKKTEIHGTRGSVIVEQDDLLLWQFADPLPEDEELKARFARKVGGTGGASDPKAISHAGHRAQLQDFVDAIHAGRPPLITGEEGRKAVELVLAIYAAARSGTRVSLPLVEA